MAYTDLAGVTKPRHLEPIQRVAPTNTWLFAGEEDAAPVARAMNLALEKSGAKPKAF